MFFFLNENEYFHHLTKRHNHTLTSVFFFFFNVYLHFLVFLRQVSTYKFQIYLSDALNDLINLNCLKNKYTLTLNRYRFHDSVRN